jgi:hypothetical protein
MATNFPTSVDVLTNPVSNDSLNSPSHSAQHANANDAIEAIETTLFAGGINYTGLVHINTTSFSASTSVTVNNCFTSTYKNYIVVFNLSVTAAGGASIRWSPTAGGTAYATAANYFNAGIEQSYGTPSSISGFGNNGATASFNFGRSDSTDISTVYGVILNPQALERTSYRTFYADAVATGTQGGFLNATDQFDGINVSLSSGTGTIKIYGMRDA